jgi:hypothetical protein
MTIFGRIIEETFIIAFDVSKRNKNVFILQSFIEIIVSMGDILYC